MQMKRSRPLIAVVALGVLFGLIAGPGAYAGSTGLVADNVSANKPPYVASPPNAWPNTECDTLDPILTQNRDLVAYKCAPEADIVSWFLETTLAPAGLPDRDSGLLAAGTPVLHAHWEMRAPIPQQGVNVAQEIQGLHLFMLFQNNNRQNSRQITGDLVDCKRYSHQGPTLTGNDEFLWLEWFVNNTPDADGNPLWETGSDVGFFDPVGNILWAFVPDPPITNGLQSRCPGANAPIQTGFNDPGSRVSWTVSGNVLDLYIPQTFHYYLGAPTYLPRDWVLAAPGDFINGVFTISFAAVNVYSTPEIRVGGIQVLGPQFLTLLFTEDWTPWAANDLGIFTPQTAAVNGPSCPYQGGTGIGVLTYVQTTRQGTDMRDTDLQVNPLFGAPDGLNHFDSTGLPGDTNNPIRNQDHLGPKSCNINIPTAGRFLSSGGLSFTA